MVVLGSQQDVALPLGEQHQSLLLQRYNVLMLEVGEGSR